MPQSIAGLALALLLGPLFIAFTNNAIAEEKDVSAGQQPGAKRTIHVVGDSLGDELWGGLSVLLRHKQNIKVARGAKNSVGFTHTNLIEQIDKAFGSGTVDALVIMVGGNDDRQTFFVDGRPAALFGSAQWSKLYAESVARYMDYIAGKNIPIVWVLLPIMRSEEATAAAKLVNGIFESEARGRPQISLLPTWELTADANGAYMAHFNDLRGTKRLMRTSDGMHFTDAGQEVLADRAWKRLQEISPTFRAIAVSDSVKP